MTKEPIKKLRGRGIRNAFAREAFKHAHALRSSGTAKARRIADGFALRALRALDQCAKLVTHWVRIETMREVETYGCEVREFIVGHVHAVRPYLYPTIKGPMIRYSVELACPSGRHVMKSVKHLPKPEDERAWEAPTCVASAEE